MRACFLGQNVCALGYGVAMLQSPPMLDEETGRPHDGQFPGKRDLSRALLAQPGAGAGPGAGPDPWAPGKQALL